MAQFYRNVVLKIIGENWEAKFIFNFYTKEVMYINDFYVYEHIRLDNNTCFYVGKGRGKRYKNKSRNEHHDRIVNKYGMRAIIIKDKLTEEEAYLLERQLIQYYVFDLGYGIDIQGFRNYDNGKYLTNHTFGGNGSFGMIHSEEWKTQHSKDMTGDKNPMYGVNVWDTYSEDKANKIREKISIASTGENNPMFNVSPKERMSEEKYNKWYEKTSNRLKSQTGAKNPNSKKVYMYKNNEFIMEFSYIGECCQWLKDAFEIESKIDTIRSILMTHVKNNTEYNGFKFYLSKPF